MKITKSIMCEDCGLVFLVVFDFNIYQTITKIFPLQSTFNFDVLFCNHEIAKKKSLERVKLFEKFHNIE